MASSVSSTLLTRVAAAQQPSAQRFVIREDRFGRMFPALDPFFRDNSSRLRAAMQDIGKVGGILTPGVSSVTGAGTRRSP